MPSPRPLTQTEPPSLDWSRPSTPAATEFGDIYFSTDGGLEETRTVFLRGCGLPDGWNGRDVFTIAELGFGSGLNFLAAWQFWDQTATRGQRLHFVSIERFPFDRHQLARALTAWPELSAYAGQLIDHWPGRVKGFHRLHFGTVTLTLIHDDVSVALDSVSGLKADAWFLDGFSPSKNSAMWSDDVLAKVGKHSARGARLATFSVAGAVRQALAKAGFEVWKTDGFGRKRHRLEAQYMGEASRTHENIDRALIVGAGITGRSLAKALSRRGIDFDINENCAHPAASGNPAALVKPRFDLQDRPESRFFLSAYLHALRTYEAGATIHIGVTQIPKTSTDADRFEKLAAQKPLGDGHLNWTGAALDISSAIVIEPDKVLPCGNVINTDFDAHYPTETYSHIFLAAGFGIRELAPDLEMRFSRGQLSWAKGDVSSPIAYGGYALPYDGQVLVGATHDRLGDGDPFEIRPEDDARNLQTYSDVMGESLTPSDRTGRASIRVTSKDTLPVMAQLDEKIWALTGLGSRGFTFAPLLAEALISEICGEVSPLERAVLARFRKVI